MLGSANIDGSRAMDFMTGNLSYQIEHHLYPDLPSNRLAEISVRVRQVCDKYDLPYTSGPFLVQYAKTWRTIAKLSLPDKYLRDTADDAPETRSERMFGVLEPSFEELDPVAGRGRGLKTAIATVRGGTSSVPTRRALNRSPALNLGQWPGAPIAMVVPADATAHPTGSGVLSRPANQCHLPNSGIVLGHFRLRRRHTE
jgi:hypothetical protein